MYKRNIVILSCYHLCSGKAISITYSELVSVTFVIQHAMRIRHIFIFGRFGCTIFFHFISYTQSKRLIHTGRLAPTL
jgi:hypothetical protein